MKSISCAESIRLRIPAPPPPPFPARRGLYILQLIASAEEPGGSGGASSRIGIGGVPGFAIDRLDGFQFFLRKCFVHRWKLLANKGVEFAGHILQFFPQRIDA